MKICNKLDYRFICKLDNQKCLEEPFNDDQCWKLTPMWRRIIREIRKEYESNKV